MRGEPELKSQGKAIKPWAELTISDDYMFKRVMLLHKNICIRMLELILQIHIRDIVYVEEEKTLKNSYVSKGIRLDVYVADDAGTVYNVEIQMKHPGLVKLAKRTRYYQATIDTDLLAAGSSYAELNKTYIIFICPFSLFDGIRHIYTFRNICVEDRNLELGDEATKIFLSTKGKADDVSPDVKAFLNYIDGIMSQNEFVQEIDRAVEELKQRESEGVSYMTLAMKMREEREEGREEGRKEGRKEGRFSALLENIRSLVENGFSAEKAMDLLKVPPTMRVKLAARL